MLGIMFDEVFSQVICAEVNHCDDGFYVVLLTKNGSRQISGYYKDFCECLIYCMQINRQIHDSSVVTVQVNT